MDYWVLLNLGCHHLTSTFFELKRDVNRNSSTKKYKSSARVVYLSTDSSLSLTC